MLPGYCLNMFVNILCDVKALYSQNDQECVKMIMTDLVIRSLGILIFHPFESRFSSSCC